ncbi:hypothetical protein NDI76_05710 [Halogeometricum sp. S1BR25-6]|uniref:Halobacterial output domain-containing protein n=1 Tax=Halogeometricum salsisoli TaxID=2950536 RepID=A0ABU2GBQ2_9EURY|nr:HalOD1 output domain-containing protein [Halogeometricum sp. S1BR25-6]MDS0298231.1 hypothetical protein [Halogeometricum sp. S1BR25-6]
MSGETSRAGTAERPLGDPSRENVIYEIITLVAEVKEGDPLSLRPVSEVVDPESIETLLTGSKTDVDIAFPYEGGYVRVDESRVWFEYDYDLP